MATHDYIISNASGAAVRADLNNALAAIVSNNSNASSPSTTYAYQWWADTTTGQLKLRNSANNAWITIFELDGTMLMEDGTVSAPGLAFASDLNTGFFRSAADKINFATGGVERLEIGNSEVVFNDGSNDVNFRVESNGQSHMLFVDGGNDRVGIGVTSPSVLLDARRVGHGSVAFIADDSARGLYIKTTSDAAGLDSRNSSTALNFSIDGSEKCRVDSSGNLCIGGTSAALADIALNANGSASFGGNVQAGGNPISGTANGSVVLSNSGFIAANSNAAVPLWRGYTTGNGTQTSSILASGASTFGGSVSINGGEGLSAALYLTADQGDDNGDTWRILSNQDDNDLTFSNNVSGSYVDKATFLNNGNVKLAGGILFNNDTAAANTLDDYEEGTFTPIVQFGGSATGITYSRQEGHYTRIGRFITSMLRITLTSKGSATGELRIRGLPVAANLFTSTGIDGHAFFAADDGCNASAVGALPLTAYVESDIIYIQKRNSSANPVNLQDSDCDLLSFAITAIYAQ